MNDYWISPPLKKNKTNTRHSSGRCTDPEALPTVVRPDDAVHQRLRVVLVLCFLGGKRMHIIIHHTRSFNGWVVDGGGRQHIIGLLYLYNTHDRIHSFIHSFIHATAVIVVAVSRPAILWQSSQSTAAQHQSINPSQLPTDRLADTYIGASLSSPLITYLRDAVPHGGVAPQAGDEGGRLELWVLHG